MKRIHVATDCLHAAHNDDVPGAVTAPAVDAALSVEALLDALADRIAARVVDKLRAGNLEGYVDQVASPLGRRRHIDAIRSGALPGMQVGRRYLALRTDVEGFIAKKNTKRSAPKPQASGVEQLEEALGLIRKTG